MTELQGGCSVLCKQWSLISLENQGNIFKGNIVYDFRSSRNFGSLYNKRKMNMQSCAFKLFSGEEKTPQI